jgi:hypothetical protein
MPGGACTADADCGTGGACLLPVQGWSSGYCIYGCLTQDDCGPNGVCVDIGSQAICFSRCGSGFSSCRSGYACQPLDSTYSMCWPDCTANPALNCGEARCNSSTRDCDSFSCTSATQCSTGSTCTSSSCRCTATTNCGANRRCYTGTGTCGCANNTFCGPGRTCDLSTGRCS